MENRAENEPYDWCWSLTVVPFEARAEGAGRHG